MKIEVWSDVVCPWCYVGKRRLETALEAFGEEVEVEWKSFELDPNAKGSRDVPLDQALARKYGMSIERARGWMQQMIDMAEEEGLEFNFDDAKGGNTFAAHRVLHLAKVNGLGGEMKERLLRAYFTEGRDISDEDVLTELAADVGIDADAVEEMFDGYDHAEAVRRDELRAQQIGITGVPFFLVDGKYGVPGAQMPDTLLHVLNRARDERVEIVTPAGESCEDDVCSPDRSTG